MNDAALNRAHHSSSTAPVSPDHRSGRPRVAQQTRTSLVFGASGFVGRRLVMDLLVQGVAPKAVVRSDRSAQQMLSLLDNHDVPAAPSILLADFVQDGFGWAPAAVDAAEVCSVAGSLARSWRI